jgi:hypothetical protein
MIKSLCQKYDLIDFVEIGSFRQKHDQKSLCQKPRSINMIEIQLVVKT